MAKTCAICAKSVHTGFQLSHSHIRTKRRWNPNLQRVKTNFGGTVRRINVCTRCLKSGKVPRAL